MFIMVKLALTSCTEGQYAPGSLVPLFKNIEPYPLPHTSTSLTSPLSEEPEVSSLGVHSAIASMCGSKVAGQQTKEVRAED